MAASRLRLLVGVAIVAAPGVERVDEQLYTNPRTWDGLVLPEQDQALIELCMSKTEGDVADKVQALIDQGADPSTVKDYNYTALMWAAIRDKPKTVRVLLDAGADTEPISAWGRNVLFLAAWDSRNEVAEALIEYGANVSARADHDHWTALHKAAERGNERLVAMLLAAGADPLARTKALSKHEKEDAKAGRRRTAHVSALELTTSGVGQHEETVRHLVAAVRAAEKDALERGQTKRAARAAKILAKAPGKDEL